MNKKINVGFAVGAMLRRYCKDRAMHVLFSTFVLSMILPVTGLAAPVTYCRYVPERIDDFAWKNDDGYNGLALFYTTGPAGTTVEGLEKLSLEKKNDNTDSVIRFAIRIGTHWYASAQNFGGANTGWTLKEMTGDFSDPSKWVELTAVSGPGGELTPGSAPSSALSGTINGYGIYAECGSTPEAGDHVRFDNFQIQGVPAF